MTIEVAGMLWKRRPGAVASAAEFAQARSLIMEIHQLEEWNPWVREDRTGEYEAAVAVFGQWTRAEPDFRQKTDEEIQAEHEQWRADLEISTKAEAVRRNQERAARAAAYDPEWAHARLALLEQRAALDAAVEERDGIASRQLYPAMPEDARQQRLVELDRTIAERTVAVQDLAGRMGDAEAVADENGWLPSERREFFLQVFAAQRVEEVRELRERVTRQRAELKATKGRTERAPICDALRKDSGRLEFLEAIPPLTAADMCSECVSPASWHGYRWKLSEASPCCGPCSAWPQWRQRLQKVREMPLASATKQSGPPPSPEPQPLTVIPGGLPIEEVITRLTAIQADHPGATVRRGRRNQWEVWPP
jgi:hypothetical protein